MKKGTKHTLTITGLAIIILGAVIPNLPYSWISCLPGWFVNIVLFCAVVVLLFNLFWFLKDMDELSNKKKRK